MGSPKPNPNVNAALQQNLGQQRNFQNAVMGGLGGAQNRSDQVFNAQFGGYQNLLSGMQQPGGGTGGGGGGGMNASIAAIQGLSGPGNPWAGQLGRDIRTREMSVLPGFYDRIKAEQTRLQNIQGGYNPGFTTQMAKLAREQAQQGQEAVLNTEIKLGEKAAQAAAANAAFEMQKQAMIAGMRGRAAGAASASAQQDFRNQMAVLDAMGGMRGQTPGEVGMYIHGGLGGLGAAQGMGGQYAQYNPATVPGWQRALGAAGAVAGGLFGGGGAFAPGGRWG